MKWLLLFFVSSHAMGAETSFEVITPRGVKLAAKIALPDAASTSKLAVLVAAPGKNYHMDLPIFTHLRESGSRAGYAVVTFNWNFFTEKKEPSKDYLLEQEDLRAVVAAVRADPRLDPSRVIISGKSLGTLIAYSLFQSDPEAFALHLLTPLCETDEEMAQFYPAMVKITRPVLFASGTEDAGCNPEVVKKSLTLAGRNIALLMVPGAHGFELGPNSPEWFERNESNVKAVTSMIAQWGKAQLGL